MTDNIASVTIDTTGTFSLDLDVTSTDTDNSEDFTRIVIENVQRGITIDDTNATMAISGTDTNIWFIDIPNQELTGGTSTYTVDFVVDQSLQYSADTSIVKITTYAQDTGAETDDIQEATQTIEFVNNLHTETGTASSTIDVGLTVNTITVTEDTQFALDGIVDISLPTGGVNDDILSTDSVTYTLTFSDLINVSFDTENSTYTDNNINSYNGEYYLTVTGTKANIQTTIETALSNIKMVASDDYNKNNAGDDNQLSFDVKLTAYTGAGYARDTTDDINFAVDVTPVTDDITSSVTQTHTNEDTTAATSAQEDGTTTVKITFDTVDDPDYKIVQGASDSTDATTVAITHTSGIYGTLTWDGGTYTFSDTNKIANVNIEDINDGSLKFTPTDDASGSANFSYTVYAKEIAADNISSTTSTFTVSVAAVADGLSLLELSGSGNEDEFIQIYADATNETPLSNAIQIDDDGSEIISSVFIEDVPGNFLIYTGESESQALATKGDATGSVTIDGEEYTTYTWTINISDGIPKVWLKAPEGWSSTTDVALTLDTLVKDGSDYTNVYENFTVSVNSVVDGFTSVTSNDTVQTVSEDVAINLNAQAGDLDGSETGILTLSGFDASDVTFQQDGTTIASTYDSGTDTYTISSIDLDTDKLNELTFQKDGLEGETISYSFTTIETDDNEESSAFTGTFTATTDTIVDTSGTGTDGVTDRLELTTSIDLSNISSTSIEKIDISDGGDITALSLSDVVNITDSSNDLIIIADSSDDTVTLDNTEGTWTKSTATTEYGGENFYTYTNSGNDTVTLKIEENATVNVA
jgi:hypothetical protein